MFILSVAAHIFSWPSVLDQLTLRTSRSVATPADNLNRYTSKTAFKRWYTKKTNRETLTHILSPPCISEDSWSGEGLPSYLDRGCPRLQLASNSPARRVRWCGQREVHDQFIIGTPCGMFKPAEPSVYL